jgi:hypothetical protein
MAALANELAGLISPLHFQISKARRISNDPPTHRTLRLAMRRFLRGRQVREILSPHKYSAPPYTGALCRKSIAWTAGGGKAEPAAGAHKLSEFSAQRLLKY